MSLPLKVKGKHSDPTSSQNKLKVEQKNILSTDTNYMSCYKNFCSTRTGNFWTSSRFHCLNYFEDCLRLMDQVPRVLGLSPLPDGPLSDSSGPAPDSGICGSSYRQAIVSKEKLSPNVGLEPTTLRLRVSCSTD